MTIDITALYCCLDDFCKVFDEWGAHRLIPSEGTRRRAGKLSRSEMLFIVVLFHLSPYKNFKTFYLYVCSFQGTAIALRIDTLTRLIRMSGATPESMDCR
ncbi:MAG: hypothetical protein JOZ17_23620 [Acetobacteraceae bacterium]|jgi:hypothetical protein|nr:hypothetical protein [Acetobacteraceae bacterium]